MTKRRFIPIPPHLAARYRHRDQLAAKTAAAVGEIGPDQTIELLEGQADRVRRERNAVERLQRSVWHARELDYADPNLAPALALGAQAATDLKREWETSRQAALAARGAIGDERAMANPKTRPGANGEATGVRQRVKRGAKTATGEK